MPAAVVDGGHRAGGHVPPNNITGDGPTVTVHALQGLVLEAAGGVRKDLRIPDLRWVKRNRVQDRCTGQCPAKGPIVLTGKP